VITDMPSPERPGRDGLEREVAAWETVLPVLSSQLRETASHVETSVVSVCSAFSGMAARARETVALASRSTGAIDPAGGASDSLADATDAARCMLEELLLRVEKSRELSESAVARVTRLERDVERIARTLDDVDRMARGTRLLALNAAIEAAHLGAAGRTFGVVAKEIEDMSRFSTQTNATIRATVHELVADIEGAATDWRAIAAVEAKAVESSRHGVSATLDRLRRAGAEMQRTVDAASGSASSLAAEIGDAVTALQFQDAVSQRIEHVVGALEKMAAALTAAREGHAAPATDGCAGRDNPLAALLSSYTMLSERDAQARHADGTGQPHGVDGSSAGSIELF
jgi:methyl-accepting chemotaxis protein